jgi:hypothetical protein
MSRAWTDLDRQHKDSVKRIVLEVIWAIGAFCLVTGLTLIAVAIAAT